MFTLPDAAGEVVAVGGVAPCCGIWDGAGADPDADGVGEVAAWAVPCEWVTLGKMSQ